MLENGQAERLSLDGEWQIEIAGQTGKIKVPSVWERQGYPAAVEAATYSRSFDVPAEWAGRRVWMRFGAVSYAVAVSVNGIDVGRHEGLWTPFELDVTDAIRPGETNMVTLHIIKPLGEGDTYPYREVLVGFLPYVSITFGGVWQSVELVAHRAPAFEIERLHADWPTGQVQLTASLVELANVGQNARVVAEIVDRQGIVVAREESAALSDFSSRIHVPKPDAWSPSSPRLYTLWLRLIAGDTTLAETSRLFGFRRLQANGERLLFNNEPVVLRGVLSWGWDPATLAPIPTDDGVRDEFRRVHDLGFNLIKLCLFVPPENVFRIADEEGMLLWLELPMWLPRLSDHLREQARIEYRDILQRVHHHPSVVIYSLGCELGADMADADLLSTLNTITREATTGVLVCDNSGSGEAYQGLSFDYADFSDYHFYSDLHYFVPLLDHFRRDWKPPRPWIFGEYSDSDTYRDPAKLTDENGEQPWWREVFGVEGNPTRWDWPHQEQKMAANSLPFSDAQLEIMTNRQAFDVRKFTVEKTRARREAGGYVITGLRDTPVSTAGMFDDRNQPKFDAEAFKQFNADNVLLLEQGRARHWVHGGDQPAPLDLFDRWAGSAVTFRVLLAHVSLPQSALDLEWQLHGSHGIVQQGLQPIERLPEAGSCREIAALDLVLPEVSEPGQWRLFVSLGDGVHNDWPLWVYPRVSVDENVVAYDPVNAFSGLWPRANALQDETRVVIASVYTPELAAFVEKGGRAILINPQGGGLPVQAVPFWRESIRLLYDHPVMNKFPHEGYVGLQFYHLATDHAFMPDIGLDVTPVIGRLDARLFTVSNYLVDVRYGRGRLFASTLRFFGGAGDQVTTLSDSPAAICLLRLLIDESGKVVESPRA